MKYITKNYPENPEAVSLLASQDIESKFLRLLDLRSLSDILPILSMYGMSDFSTLFIKADLLNMSLSFRIQTLTRI